MPKFDDTIRQAVMRACEIAGSQTALCRKTGLSTSIMSRYLNGDVRYINPGTWELLYPHIAPYLPEDFQPKQTVSSGCCEVIVKIVRRLSEKEAVLVLSMMAAYFPEAAAAAQDFPLINRPQSNPVEIDEAILNAMKAAVKKSGSQLHFAQITGIKQQNISRYLNRQVTFINAKTWQLLAPHLPGFNNHKEEHR